MFYVRLVQGAVEEELVLYAFFGSRVQLVPRESSLLAKWYKQDVEGVVFPVTKSGPQLQSEGNSLVILEVSSFTEGTPFLSWFFSEVNNCSILILPNFDESLQLISS